MDELQGKINYHGIIAIVLAVVLQIVLAPAMTIGAAMPNFIAVYVLCATLRNASSRPMILAFVLGLIFDLLGSGPVGAMAFCLVLITTLASVVYRNMSNDSWMTAMIIIVVSCLLIELLYGIIMLLVGAGDGFGSALIHRILPCTLYDIVIAAFMHPIVSRLVAPRGSTKTDSIPMIG
jgi:rod shape-determining protein MreD